ncbi:M35 family metallo-endopeptidase [Gemmatimonas phototrophica]|uniref:Lysine-specific metallo-endopeptidase domain-containing protein n=1 Tax=Gemmatimonas phototrophica TaxID=1379270 RepID=A0A143BNP0_9BACT|nr:M35 family metallo-endopeptidase [Gemmatimonas phototrophica]AMW06152.1 hypothetical protein GEMMAAP_17900 [Gemmatimonas phototrophica]
MPNHSFKNFASVSERVQWESALLDAATYMPRIVKDAKANSSDIATRAYALYFGAFDKARWTRVVTTLSAIDFAISSAGVTFVRVYTGKGAQCCAATNAPYGRWKDQTPGMMADSAHKRQHGYVMTVGDDFYTADNSIDRTIKSAQFNTLCHEFSHLVSNTDDPVYGNIQSRALAIGKPDTAVACAENYGFYCEMLYTEFKRLG